MDDFINKYNGQTKGYPTDNSYKGECLSIVKLYIKEILGFNPPPSGTNSAYGYWSNFPAPLPNYFEKIPNTPSGVPQKGDIVIWSTAVGGGYGHIAIFVEGNASSFRSFDQNWSGKAAHIQGHYYTNVIGWLHPKGEDMNNLTPDQARIMYQRCLLREPENNDVLQNRTLDEMTGGIKIELESRFGALSGQISGLQSQIEGFARDVASLKARNEQLENQNATLVTKNTELSKELTDMHELLEDSQDQVRKLEKEIEMQGKTIDRLKKELEDLSNTTACPSLWRCIWDAIKNVFKKGAK